jgi:hypothetical protein
MSKVDLRKLLIVGAMSRIRWIVRKGVLPDNLLGRLMTRRPRMAAAVALAKKMARIIGGDDDTRGRLSLGMIGWSPNGSAGGVVAITGREID